MLRLIGFLLKVVVFAVVVLVLGNWVRWEGKTISDQVKSQLAQAERIDVVEKVKGWAGGSGGGKRSPAKKQPGITKESGADEIPSSERQKLRELIQELNSSR